MRRCPACNSFFKDDLDVCPHDNSQLVDVQLGAKTQELEGTVFAGHYEIIRRIGEGGMGMVYEALDQHNDAKLAMKVLHRDVSSDERAVKRFFSEARVLASLNHPNIITLHDFGRSDDGRLYIAMELLSGRPADVLIKYKALSHLNALEIVDQIAGGLGEAHLQGVIHRDLKPANIFASKKPDGSLFVTVLDFGIAKVSGGQNLTVTGKVMGTPSYMAPEQIMGKQPDPRTDIYALGCVAYELLTGRPPFVSDAPLTLLYAHLNDAPPRINDLDTARPFSKRLEDMLLSFLAKDVDDRPRNTVEVRALVAPFLEDPNLIIAGHDDGDATQTIDGAEAERRMREILEKRGEAHLLGSFDQSTKALDMPDASLPDPVPQEPRSNPPANPFTHPGSTPAIGVAPPPVVPAPNPNPQHTAQPAPLTPPTSAGKGIGFWVMIACLGLFFVVAISLGVFFLLSKMQ